VSRPPASGPYALRRALAAAGRRLYQAGLIAATDGNLSARLDEYHLLVTPAGVAKGALEPAHMVVVDLEGRPVSPGRPSSELGMHLVVYRCRPDVSAAIHAHPPWVIAASLRAVRFDLVPEAVVALGGVAQLDYTRPGTPAVGEALEAQVHACNSFILTRHGSLTLGATLDQAFQRLEALEHNAKIALLARLDGDPAALSADEVRALRAAPEPAAAGAEGGGDDAIRGASRRPISDEERIIREMRRGASRRS
jgi:L-fuculose-phosphate aldolase